MMHGTMSLKFMANYKFQNKPKQQNRSSANQRKATSVWLQILIYLSFAVGAHIRFPAIPCGFCV